MANENVINTSEGVSPVKDLINYLTTELIKSNSWELSFPAKSEDIKNISIIHTTIVRTIDEKESSSEFYLKLEREEEKYNFIYATIGRELNSNKNDLEQSCSPKVRCAWYKSTNPKIEFQDWLPVKVWMNYGNGFANIILQGDDSVDIPPNYDSFLTSFLIVGAVKSYKDAQNKPVDDGIDNFFIAAGSDIMPERTTTFGLMTGNGNTDIIAVGTRSGVPYQGHFVKYDASSPFIRKNWIKESSWTLKYHVSPINVCHHVDRERGQWPELLIGEKSGLNQTNLLTLEQDGTKQTWQFFDITAPYKFWNNGPNPTYGLFLRKG